MSKLSKLAVASAVLVVSFLLLSVVLRVSGQGSRPSKEKDAEVQWEYMVVYGGRSNLSGVGDLGGRKQPDNSFFESSIVQRNLDKLGQKGWELVAVYGPPLDPVYYLKRQKEEKEVR